MILQRYHCSLLRKQTNRSLICLQNTLEIMASGASLRIDICHSCDIVRLDPAQSSATEQDGQLEAPG